METIPKRTNMHEYQNYCADFLLDHPEVILILDMGLGKSIITLTTVGELLIRCLVRRVLVCDHSSLLKTKKRSAVRSRSDAPAQAEGWSGGFPAITTTTPMASML